MKKTKVSGTIRVKTYDILHRAVVEGLEYGWMRAHKYSEAPKPEDLKEQMLRAIMNTMSEYFVFDEDLHKE